MRPEILFPYFAELSSLRGVGPALAAKLRGLIGGETVIDLLLHLPVRWVDRSLREAIDRDMIGQTATVTGRITHLHLTSRGGREPSRITIADKHGTSLDIVYFRASPQWLTKRFVTDRWVLISGLIEEFRTGLQIVHPDHVIDPDKGDTIPPVEPIYRKTAGVTDALLHKLVKDALGSTPDLPDWCPPETLGRQQWPTFREALTTLHLPHSNDPDAFARARSRLAFDELLAREILISRARAARAAAHSFALPASDTPSQAVLDRLPFTPTGAQRRVMAEVSADLAEARPMRRIVQGDVGSGKTLIAAMAIVQTASADKRAVVMCPTEILARQQARTLTEFLKPLGFVCQPLTGGESAKARRLALEDFAAGRIHALSGTQALIQDGVDLPGLALIVIDEQHRFGIADRMRLLAKATSPHVLVMTATPIPRTLSMMLSADMDASILDEMPAGRIPVRTSAVPATRMDAVTDALLAAVRRGEQAYWICPALDSERDEANVVKRHASLSTLLTPPPGLIHGRMTSAAKDNVLESFRSGRTRVLVATTVVEVGLDIPDARIMVIEHAERFGLAQLHQLRGRVGRGRAASTCLLLYQPPLSPEARKRIEALRAITDGFEIAQIDFSLRGAGDILGLKQSGLPQFRVFDLARDAALPPHAHAAITMLGTSVSDTVQLAVELLRPRLA